VSLAPHFTELRRRLEKALVKSEKANDEVSLALIKPVFAMTLGNLGMVQGNFGDYAEKKRLLEKTLVIFKAVHGETHPVVATSLNNLGAACGSLG